jgi:uncharacterized protein (DUF58 family)
MTAQQPIRYLDPATVSRLKSIEVMARMIVEGFITGLHKSPYHGFSVEFAEHRPYNSGEPLRNIDWKVFGRTDKLYTKRYEEETNLRCHLVLDVSDSMRYPRTGQSKLEYSAYLAAALGYLMFTQHDAVGLTLFDDQIRLQLQPRAKYSWLLPIFRRLEQVVDDQNIFTHRTATAKVLHELVQKIGRRGLVVIITDLFGGQQALDELFPALQHLRHHRHEVVIFQPLHVPSEVDFDLGNQPIILQDLETGEELEVMPEDLREDYQKQMKHYMASLKNKCRELNIDFNTLDITKPWDKALSDYLIKRRMLSR